MTSAKSSSSGVLRLGICVLLMLALTAILSLREVGAGAVEYITTSPPPTPVAVFQVKMNATPLGEFTEVKSIGSRSEVVEVKSVDAFGREIVKLVPGKLAYNRVILKRVMRTSDDALWKWRRLVETGQKAYATVEIAQMNSAGGIFAQWVLTNAWPCAIEAPMVVKESGSEVGVEIIELVCESYTRTR